MNTKLFEILSDELIAKDAMIAELYQVLVHTTKWCASKDEVCCNLVKEAKEKVWRRFHECTQEGR